MSIPPIYGTRASRVKRARVIESDEDENIPPVAGRRLSRLRKLQRLREKVDEAIEENSAKLQAENNKELTTASRARDMTQTIERRRVVSNTSDQNSPIKIEDGETPTISSNPNTLSGKASVLEQRLEVAKEKVAVKSRLYQEAKSDYEKAQVEHRTLTKKRE